MPGSLRSSLPILAVALLAGACAHQQTSVPPPAPPVSAAPGPAPRDATDAPLFSQVDLERIDATQPQVERASAAHGVPADLINAIIWVESRFDPKARSSAGARGLMQLMPATARALAHEMGTRPRPFDPEFNVSAGTLFLAKLLHRYEGNVFLALAAYHGGPGNVDGWRATGNAPDYSRRYVQMVETARLRFIRLAQSRTVAPAPVLVKTKQRAKPPTLPPTPGERLTMAESTSTKPDPKPGSVTQPMEPRGPGLDPDVSPPAPRPPADPQTASGLPVTELPEKTRPMPAPPPAPEIEPPFPPPAPEVAPPSTTPNPSEPVESEPEVGVGVLPSLKDL